MVFVFLQVTQRRKALRLYWVFVKYLEPYGWWLEALEARGKNCQIAKLLNC